MIEISVVVYIFVILIYFFILNRGYHLLNPASLFVFTQTIMFLGSLRFLDLHLEEDRVHLVVMVQGIIVFIAGIMLRRQLSATNKSKRYWRSSPLECVENSQSFNLLLSCIIVFSVLISILFYIAVGYNIFLQGVQSLLAGSTSSTESVTNLRLNTYAGERYFAPGYVNQFKNFLLPLLIGYLFARYIYTRQKQDLVMALVLAPLSLMFLLGTGQRSGLFLVMLMVVLFFNSLPTLRIQKVVRKVNVSLLIVGTLFFLISTVILGRSVVSINSWGDWLIVLSEGGQRIFQVNQEVGVEGFRFVFDRPTQSGGEWLQRVIRLLPGAGGGSTLDNELHAHMYGSPRGTAPVSLWGSIWYNFGAIGVVTVPLLMGYFYQSVYLRLLSKPKTLFRLLIYSGICVPLGLWVSAGPDFLADVGILAIITMRLMVSFIEKYKRQNLRGIGGVAQANRIYR